MVDPTTKAGLALKLNGTGLMTYPEQSGQRGVTVAIWQVPANNTPKRVVVRIDGKLNKSEDEDGVAGFPCAVMRVDYSQGGMQREVYIDYGSALPLHATSVEVTPVWDARRIARLAGSLKPCTQQQLSAAISCGDDSGDTGPADARYLDVIKVDETTTDEEDVVTEWSIHPIPAGARGFRFLDALVNGEMFSVPGATTIIAWSVAKFASYPRGVLQLNTNGATDTSVLIAPPLATYLFLGFPADTISTFGQPAWIEFDLSLETLPGY